MVDLSIAMLNYQRVMTVTVRDIEAMAQSK
jgi:hypothetical protein